MEASRIISEKVILKDIRRSNKVGGRGITINTKIATTAKANVISLFFESMGTCPLN
jgi:hypothetical protein